MKNQKGFISITILIAIIVGVLVLGGGGYYGLKKYQNYQAKEIEKEKQLQELLAKQQKTIDEAQNEIDILKKKPAQIIKTETTKTITSKEKTIAEIARDWSPSVVNIYCEWHYSNGDFHSAGSGSGFMNTSSDGRIGIVTNRHVVRTVIDEKVYFPVFCNVYFLNKEKYTINPNRDSLNYHPNFDIGYIFLSEPSDYVKKIAGMNDDIGGSYCGNPPDIGDKIVVLGYPGIGSSEGITVTDGIISGIEGDYYVTSAKIDHGNSGGIAVSIKNNCIIGMPSASVSGSVESLGRILSSKAILSI